MRWWRKGIPSEKIFEGPRTEHGFIMDEELKRAGRRKVIYVSGPDSDHHEY
jgi:hypothetical protein